MPTRPPFDNGRQVSAKFLNRVATYSQYTPGALHSAFGPAGPLSLRDLAKLKPAIAYDQATRFDIELAVADRACL